jgi:hypothetical protein
MKNRCNRERNEERWRRTEEREEEEEEKRKEEWHVGERKEGKNIKYKDQFK